VYKRQVYTIVFYEPIAIKYNKEFSEDRGSCYINSRKDYLKVISQAKSFYVMIYKNNKPVSRLWLLCDEWYEGFVIYNPYGYKFKQFEKFFFSNEEEYKNGNHLDLESAIGLYVNNDIVIMTKTIKYNDLVYEVECPNCYSITSSGCLEFKDKIVCDECNDRVYSSYYEEYIDENYAIFSNIHDSYLLEEDVYYSTFYDDYLLKDFAYRVYNIDMDSVDFVLEEDSVYSEYLGERLIKDQAVFSEYYDDYLLADSTDTVFSKAVNSYINKYDDNFVYIDGDYVLTEDIEA